MLNNVGNFVVTGDDSQVQHSHIDFWSAKDTPEYPLVNAKA